MEQIILNIKNKSKLPFLKELLHHLDFVEISEQGNLSDKETGILEDLDRCVEQVNLHKEGKIKLKTIQEALDEL
jgi:hypothetical protein